MVVYILAAHLMARWWRRIQSNDRASSSTMDILCRLDDIYCNITNTFIHIYIYSKASNLWWQSTQLCPQSCCLPSLQVFVLHFPSSPQTSSLYLRVVSDATRCSPLFFCFGLLFSTSTAQRTSLLSGPTRPPNPNHPWTSTLPPPDSLGWVGPPPRILREGGLKTHVWNSKQAAQNFWKKKKFATIKEGWRCSQCLLWLVDGFKAASHYEAVRLIYIH